MRLILPTQQLRVCQRFEVDGFTYPFSAAKYIRELPCSIIHFAKQTLKYHSKDERRLVKKLLPRAQNLEAMLQFFRDPETQ